MKKFFFILIIIFAWTVVSYADDTKTCKVKGTDGSVEMSVMVTDAANGKCIISFSNDTERNVNVRYKVSSYIAGTEDCIGSVLVYANSEATRQISFGKAITSSSVKISSLTGEKCE